jgi:hypothetical protein
MTGQSELTPNPPRSGQGIDCVGACGRRPEGACSASLRLGVGLGNERAELCPRADQQRNC